MEGENEKVSDEKKKALSSAKHQTLLLKMMFRLIEREHDDHILIPVCFSFILSFVCFF